MKEKKSKKIKDLKGFGLKASQIQGNRVKPGNDFIPFEKKEINQSIPERFEAIVKKYPDKIAIKIGSVSVTYDALNQKANHAAQCVLSSCEEKKSGKGAAALLFGQDTDMIAAIMGVLKTGMFYVPLDASYPEDRLEYMLEDSEARVIVTNENNLKLALKLSDKVNKNIVVINMNEIPIKIAAGNPGVSIDPGDLAYILYTSGSTGKPKGVMQNHRNVLHHARVYTNALHINDQDKLTLFSSYSFDAAKMDIYGALLNGAALYPYDIKAGDNLQRLPWWLWERGITIYHSIPTIYRYFTDLLAESKTRTGGFPQLRLIVLGGEAVFKKDVDNYKKYFSNHCIFINGLGPTESTVTVQYFIDKNTEISREAVPVGYPVEETQVLLLTEYNREAGILGVGEILFKSDYLALGYWKNPELTQKVFSIDPLTGKDRVYRTGDLGRRLPDGSIEYAGRKDFQMKISGYRIEPGEIESRLDQVTGIKKSIVVSSRDSNNDHFLTAYYTQTNERKVGENHLVEVLKKTLPDYMVPSVFISLDEFPLTPTGKIDRQKLAQQEVSHLLSREYVPPGNEIESQLAEVWEEVLKVNKPGVAENFFVLGGNSLKAILLVSEIQKKLHTKISLKELFKTPTIRDLAGYIRGKEPVEFNQILMAEKREYYPLSSAQLRLFILQGMDIKSTAYNMPGFYILEEESCEQRFTDIFRKLAAVHESLRTSFHMIDEEPVQRIHASGEKEITLEHYDLKRGVGNAQDIVSGFVRPFDPGRGPLLRVGLLRRRQDPQVLMVDMHHIISDGISHAILVRDFINLYQGGKLPAHKIQYKDYALWQTSKKQREWLKQQESYWLAVFGGDIPVLDLPFDFPRPVVQSFVGSSIHFEIGPGETNGLKTLGLDQGATLYMVLLSLYNVLLAKLSGREVIIVGSPLAGRGHPDTREIIGMFANTLALLNRPGPGKRYREFLREVKLCILDAFENQDYPFEELVGRVKVPRDVTRNPLFDVMLVLQNMEILPDQAPGPPGADVKTTWPKFRPYEVKNKIAKFDLTLTGIEAGDRLKFVFEYCSQLFKEATIKRFIDYFRNIVSTVLNNPDTKLFEIEILPAAEKKQLLYDFNDTVSGYLPYKTLHELLVEQVKRTPNHTALVGKEEGWKGRRVEGERTAPSVDYVSITYRELNEKSHQLAQGLRSKGIGPDTIVAIMVERSVEMIMAILGILKSGGAYLPMDPGYPEERINYMLADSGAKILLTWQDISGLFSTQAKNNRPKGTANHQHLSLWVHAPVTSLAYVIYTSGTTARPKGVMVTHGNLRAYLHSFQQEFEVLPADIMIQQASYTFDAFGEEVYPVLLKGAKLAIPMKDEIREIGMLKDFIIKIGVTIIDCSPLLLNELNRLETGAPGGMRVHTFISGGDELRAEYVSHLLRIGKVYNTYGPTETTVCASYFNYNECSSINVSNVPIGKPISNYSIYILGKNNELQPIGVTGELYISGPGVTRGYLNQPELTAEKFDHHLPMQSCIHATMQLSPHYPITPLPHRPIYLTGDLGRWMPDGNIEFLGRIDQQVKIRGFRIELGEIAGRLLSHKDIKDAVVVVRERKGGANEKEKYLCAYIAASRVFEVFELREYLSGHLPGYMVPGFFVQLEKIPLTSSGKLNPGALPEPGTSATSTVYQAPRNDIEKKLVEVWSQVLGEVGHSQIGINDNFFELGGDSINAIRISAKLKKYGLDLRINDLFLHPVIKELAGCVEETSRKIDQGTVEGEVPLTPIQQWFFRSFFTGRHHYNHGVVLHREQGFNEKILTRVFTKLTTHHDALRMVYDFSREQPVVQKNRGLQGKLFDLEVVHLAAKDNHTIRGRIETRAAKIQESIDLENGPLVKLGLFKTPGGDHLLIVIHHLVIDGISWRILFEDITSGYNQLEQGKEIQFQEKTDSFKYWAEKLNEYASSLESKDGQLKYWQKLETEGLKAGPLPRDHEIPQEKKKRKYIEFVRVNLDREETGNLLEKVNWPYNTEINDILLTALGLAVNQWTGLEKVLIELEGHGREPIIEGIDISRTVGWFTGQYPVILDMKQSRDLSYTIRCVKETLRRIPDKGTGYGIWKYLTPREKKNGLSFALDPEINFNYLGQFGWPEEEESQGNPGSIQFSRMSSGKNISPEIKQTHTLDINGMVTGGKLTFTFSYNSQEYDKTTIKALVDSFKHHLLQIIRHCIRQTREQKQELTPSDVMVPGCPDISLEEFSRITGYTGSNIPGNPAIRWIYSLSPMQKGMLYHWITGVNRDVYFNQYVFRLEGIIDSSYLEASFNRLIERYDILRTIFIYEGLEEPLQIVFKLRTVPFHYEDISNLLEEEQLLYLEESRKKDEKRGFDLGKDMLMRISLFRVGKNSHHLLWSHHHILMDGWCTGIIFKELVQIYEGLRKGGPLELQEVNPYKNYISWLENRDKSTGFCYWENYLAGYDGQGGLIPPGPGKQLNDDEYRLEEYMFIIDKEEINSLNRWAGSIGVTINMVFQGLWGILLQRYNNSDDVVFGGIVSGRPPEIAGIENMVGLFINTVPVRIKTHRDQEFSRFLRDFRETDISSRSYEYLPLADIQSKSHLKRNLIDHLMIFENYPFYEQLKDIYKQEHGPVPDFYIKTVNAYEQTNYNFNILISPHNLFRIKFSYNASVFEADFVKRIGKHLKKLLGQVVDNPDIIVKEMEIITGEEKKQVVFDFNRTAAQYPGDKTIGQLFERQVERTPDNTALVGPTAIKNRTYISYRELNEKSDQLSYLLIEKGVGLDTIVGIMVERSIEMIIGILGILKAGGAYLPIDPGYPEERKQYMLVDSGTKILLASSDILVKVKTGEEVRFIEIINISNLLSSSTLTLTSTCQVRPINLAYVIYTSGSTGKPKGVMLEHRNLVNLLIWGFKFTNLDFSSVLQFASISFDASFHEIFSVFLSGGKLCLIDDESRTNIQELFKKIEKNDIKTVFLPISLLRVIFNDEDYTCLFPRCVKHIQTAGEQVVVSTRFRNYLQTQGVYLHNHYGPSETHVVTALTMDPANEIPRLPPIGKPVSNTGIYILDKYKKFQPKGIPGELYIGGIQVGRGYLNQPRLTTEKFDHDLKDYRDYHDGYHRSYKSYKSYILYRTGDLARWLPDGNIEFLGRIDSQVKIRGFRVELGEIESHLSNHTNIKEAVVIIKDRGKGKEAGDKYLYAYIVPAGTGGVTGLREYLEKKLPHYMIPDYFVTLEQVPLTPSGKIDRKALLSSIESHVEMPSAYAAPFTPLEKIVADTWKEVLQLPEVGVYDNFFEIGGNSINILKVHSKLKKALKVDTPVVRLFKYPTIHSLALYLEEGANNKNSLNQKSALYKEITRGKDRLKEKVVGTEKLTGLDIAVIGMSGVFPGARDIHEFWENLKNGIESIAFFSHEELKEVGIPAGLLDQPGYVKARGILEGIEYFDASFFGYTPQAVQNMDPQVRIFHQCVWHTLEDAGYDPFAYPGRIGIYAGSSSNIYWEAITLLSSVSHSSDVFQSMLLMNKDFLCTHISYKLSLKGPAYSIQTACSTSLVAIHVAVQALLNGECEMALAGGVTITYPWKRGYIYQPGTVLAPDGHCRAFDANSQGMVGGNGAAAVVLKPLDRAKADRDHIYAIIKGSAINNDGDRKVGYTAPSVEGQAEVIRAAHYTAGIEPESITYVETHGTGTELGDPVEVDALKMAFNTSKRGFCGIGSVKTNVGHLDCAAGAAGFIKTVLALKHRLIPPSLHFNSPNPKLGLENSPFYVAAELKEWKNGTYPLRAGVSSLGIGGTNAHLVLEEWPAFRGQTPDDSRQETGDREQSKDWGGGSPPHQSQRYQLILLSAKSETALDKMTINLVEYFQRHLLNGDNHENAVNPGLTLADAAYTLQVGRKSFRCRKAALCSSVEEMVDILGKKSPKVQSFFSNEKHPSVIFVLTGQGSQYVNMGLDLYRQEPVFKKEMDRCFEILKPLMGYDLEEILYPGETKSPLERDVPVGQGVPDINRVDIAQPILFSFEYALSKLLMKWGIQPRAMIGYSLGEFVAACLSGVLSLEDAITLVTARARLIQEKTPEGAMLTVPLPEDQLKPLLNKDISIANVNGPSCIVAGTTEAVDTFNKEMKKKQLWCTRLNIPRASHSLLMNPIREEFENRVKAVKLSPPRIPCISNVTGRWLSGEQAVRADYWGEHLCSPVRFSQGVGELLKLDPVVFIEIGPGRILSSIIQQYTHTPPRANGNARNNENDKNKKEAPQVVSLVRHQHEKVSDDYFLLFKIGQLWLYNVKIDWEEFHAGEERFRLALPVYPFEGKRYWINESMFNQLVEQQSLAVIEKPGFTEAPQDVSSRLEPGLTRGVAPDDYEENYQAPRNELEQNIARVWQEILGIKKIGIYDDFFYLNGDSLTATQILSHIKEIYPVEISLKDFFESPTIDHLAKIIKKLLVEKVKNLSQEEKKKLALRLSAEH